MEICSRTGVTHGVCIFTLPSVILCECHGQDKYWRVDAKYLIGGNSQQRLGVVKHIATMENTANSKLSILHRNLKECKLLTFL